MKPGLGYRFGKFVRRNKVALGVFLTVAVLACTLLVTSLLLLLNYRAGQYGGLTLRSDPEGAEVWHEGERIGVTPLELSRLPLGEFTYRLVLGNHQSVTNTTALAPRMQMNDFTFLRMMASTTPPKPAGPDSSSTTEIAASTQQGATILSLQGIVEVARGNAGQWAPAQTNTILRTGDRLRTGHRSRASLRLADHSIVRINELSELTLREPADHPMKPPLLNLEDGSIHFFHDGGSTNTVPIKTKSTTVIIRG